MDEEERSIVHVTSLGVEVEWMDSCSGGGDRVGWRMGREIGRIQAALGLEVEDG